MAVVRVLRERVYSGEQISDPVNVPDRIASVRLFAQSTTFDDPATSIYLEVDESYDGGATWRFVASSGPISGGQLARDGVSRALPELTVNFHDENDRGARVFRGLMRVVGSVRFSVWAEATVDAG